MDDQTMHTFTTEELTVAMPTSAPQSADLVEVAMQHAQLPVQPTPAAVQSMPVPDQPIPAPAGLKQSGELKKPRDDDPVWEYMCWNGIYLCNNSPKFTWPDVMHI